MAERQGPWLDLWVGFRRCPLASRVVSPSGRGRLPVGLGCDRWGRVGIGRKPERIHGGEPLPASGVLLPQLLGFFLDLLGLVPHLQDFSLELPRSLGTYQRCCPLDVPALSTPSYLTAFSGS